MKNKTFIFLVPILIIGIFCNAYSHKIMKIIDGGSGTYYAVWLFTPKYGETRSNYVHWEGTTTIPISTNQNGAGDGISAADTKTAIMAGTQPWQNVSTAYINFSDAGFTSHTLNSTDGLNTIYWAEEGDPTLPLVEGFAAAYTIITVNANQELLDVDIIMNGKELEWSIGGFLDIQGVVTHELGHLLGIHHCDLDIEDVAYNSSASPTMYYAIEPLEARTLEADDKEAVTFLYPEGTFTPPAAPTLNTPANNEYNVLTGPVPLSWHPVPGATSYYLEVIESGDQFVWDAIVDKSGLTTTSPPFTNSVMWGIPTGYITSRDYNPFGIYNNFHPGIAYVWRVTAYNNGIPGPTSATRTFTTAYGVPSIIWPTGSIISGDQPRIFTIYWNPFDVESQWHLQVFPESSFPHISFLSTPVIDDPNVTTPFKQITLAPGVYRFRIRAVDEPSDWTYVYYNSRDIRPSSVISHDSKWYGSVGLPENATVNSGKKLTILNGTTITIPSGVTLTINGTLELQGNVTIIGGGSLVIGSSGTLNVLPAAVVKFANGTSVTINGTLNANGTSTQPITFTGLSGNWTGLTLNGSSNTLSWCNIIGAPVITCGTLTLNGTYTIGSNLNLSWCNGATIIVNGTLNDNTILTVPELQTITVNPGSVINCSLVMNGKLNVNGTSSHPITFHNRGIVLNGSGANNSTISYANMSGNTGTSIQVINSQNITIQYFNCLDYGSIAFSNSTGTIQDCRLSSPDCYGNRITVNNSSTVNCYRNTLWDGDIIGNETGIIYSNGSSGNIGQNDVYLFDAGIDIFNYSSPYFHNPSTGKNNRVTNCGTGIRINNNSNPVIGYNGTYCYGANSIHDNYTDIALNGWGGSSCILNALGTYWNNGNPNNAILYIHSGSQIDVGLALTVDPWVNIPLPSVQSTIQNPTSTSGTTMRKLVQSKSANEKISETQILDGVNSTSANQLLKGIELQSQNKVDQAKDFFISYLCEHPDNQQAYGYLYNCYNNETAVDITKYFESFPGAANKEYKIFLGYLYLKQGNTEAAKVVNNKIISENINTPLAMRAKLNNFYITLYNENDSKTAESILKEVLQKKELLNEAELSIAQNALQTYVNPKTGEISNISSEQSIAEQIPEKFGLLQNYPNPFNPATVIKYQLPAFSSVKLSVYDILGREVATLADGIKEAGYYTVTFDGSRLASGIYFTRLIAQPQNGNNTFIQVKKMMLMK